MSSLALDCTLEEAADTTFMARADPCAPTRDSSGDPLLGCTLAGTYRVERVLGRGGMGLLYEAEHVRLARRCAIKVLHTSHAQRRETLARFEREARALARVQSPHVIDILDVLRTPDQRTAIVTPLLVGEDLQRCLDREGRLPFRRAISLARELCEGLIAAHAAGVVHRDLKPSNLFLSTSAHGSQLKILDFGVAKLEDDPSSTRTGVVVGTPSYMAPEQARGSHAADARSDVYAAGAVLYRMVTGEMPYQGSDVASTLSRLLLEPPARPRALVEDIPLELELVIQRAMARDPNARPASAAELAAELDALATPLHAPAQSRSAARSAAAPRAALLRQARAVRPLALLLASFSVLAAAAFGAVFLHSIASLLGQDPTTRVLARAAAMVGLGFGAGTASLTLIRGWKASWSSAPELDLRRKALLRRWVRTLVALGAFACAGLATNALAEVPTPIDSAARIAGAMLVCALAFFGVPRSASELKSHE